MGVLTNGSKRPKVGILIGQLLYYKKAGNESFLDRTEYAILLRASRLAFVPDGCICIL